MSFLPNIGRQNKDNRKDKAAYLVWEDSTGETQEFRFDVVLSESHELVNEATKNPVEKGSPTTDHVRSVGDRVSLSVFATNHPIKAGIDGGEFKTLDIDIPSYSPPLLARISPGGATRGLTQLAEKGISLLSGGPGALTTLQFPEQKVRYKDQFQILKKIKDDAILCTVMTAINEYEDMIMVRLNPTKTPEEGDGYNFDCEFEHIEIVQTALVAAPKIAMPRAVAKIAKGPQNPLDGKKNNKALLKKLTDGLGVTKPGDGIAL
jgi:hypothetical protein